MFGPTVSPQLVQSGKGRIASDPALLYLPRPSNGWGLFRSMAATNKSLAQINKSCMGTKGTKKRQLDGDGA